jgi:hypothetical protein
MMRYVDSIQCGKPFYDVHICDHSINFAGTFDGIEDEVEKLLNSTGRNLGFKEESNE